MSKRSSVVSGTSARPRKVVLPLPFLREVRCFCDRCRGEGDLAEAAWTNRADSGILTAMPNAGLNPRQQRFCEGVVSGLPASRAYVEAGYSSRSPDQEASNLVRNPKVASKIAELQAKAAKKAEKTVADVIADLDRLRDEAFATGQIAAGVSAVMGAARILGMIVDKSQVEQLQHKPAPLPTQILELTEAEWVEQFSRKSQ
jgi:phage terminase small subunit